jgi:single-stranded-DNA-specific exonuclease
LGIVSENIAEFRRGLSAALVGCQNEPAGTLTLDALIDLPQISPDLLAAIQRLAPFGPGNPPVRLGCTGLTLVEETVFGKTGTHKRLVVQDAAGNRQSVIWWGGAAEASPVGEFDLALTLSPDDFNGGGAVQVEWLSARQWTPPSVTLKPEFVDWRHIESPLSHLSSLLSPLLWAEGISLPQSTLTRHQLTPAETLVIWTPPPGQDIYRQAIAQVRPRQIIVVAQPVLLDKLLAFIPQLMGLVKYAIQHKEGEVNLEGVAAVLGHRRATVRLGVDWLVAQGKLSIVADEGDWLVLRADLRSPRPEAAALETLLQTALAETAAYRDFFRRASLAALAQMAG